ncbi:MAG: type II secretion system F family protein [Planctomycetaceae bacterium]|nr:type II secretion system F family protein [Planctomycetaceae bacterium]
MDFEALVPYAMFGLVAMGAWWIMDMIASGRSRTKERLEEIKSPELRRRKGGPVKSSEKVARVVERAAPALAKPLQPKNEFEVSKIKSKLSHAGFRGEAAVSTYLGLKFVGLMLGMIVGGVTLLASMGVTQQSMAGTVFIAGLLFYLPDIVLGLLARSRKQAIFLGLPDALDLLVVCVEAGLGLDQAMRRVSEEMHKATPVICDELALSNFQLQMGRSRTEVLHELGIRTGVDDLRSLSAILIQADKFGSSIAQALRVQSDSMRTRRRQLAEEKAAKTAVKLIFPLVLFIFPGIFVVLVGPAAITMVRNMFPLMGG